MTVKVLGLDLQFSREYLDMLRAMTGFDLRHTAYKIHFALTESGNTCHLFLVLYVSSFDFLFRMYSLPSRCKRQRASIVVAFQF
jgi:hypothetical protein